MRGTAPRALAFTDRPAREAQALGTAALMVGPSSLLFANGSAPPNGALSFEYDGGEVILPVEMLNVTGAAPDFAVAARALGEGGVAHLGAGMVEDPLNAGRRRDVQVVRGAGHPLWASIEAGLEVEAPALFVDSLELNDYVNLND